MPDSKNTQDSVYLCPRLRYIKSFVDSYLRTFRDAKTPADKELALSQCLDYARTILWVVQPMAKDLGLPQHAHELGNLAQKLTALAGFRWEENPAAFPPDNGRLLMMDRIDEIDRKLNELLQSTRNQLKGLNTVVQVNFSGKGAA